MRNLKLENREMTTPTVDKGHVCFNTDQVVPKENSIIVTEIAPGHLRIHLGFLQLNYTYSTRVNIPKQYFSGCDPQAILDASEKSPSNANCRLVSVLEKEDEYELVVEFHAEKERLMKEELKLCLGKVSVKIEFNARVLGKGKGTPFLKNGIRCIGTPPSDDEMSDVLDWEV